MHPFMMQDMIFDDVPWMQITRAAEDYTPALPFIQAFERPPRPALTRSVSIGEYADYVSFSDAVIDESIKLAADEMAYKLGQSLNAMVEATGGGDGKAFQGNGLASIATGPATQSSPA